MPLKRVNNYVIDRRTAFSNRLNRLSANYATYFGRGLHNFQTQGTREATSFAYWALFSLFPLSLLLIIIATSVFGERNLRLPIDTALTELIPSSINTMIRDTITLVRVHGLPYGLFGLFSLTFGATRLFGELRRSLSRIFGNERKRAFYQWILADFLMLVTFATLLIVSVDLTSWFQQVNIQLFGRRSFLGDASSSLALIITGTVAFLLLFRLIPERRIAWRVLIPITLLAAIGYEVSRSVFDWYLQHIANLGGVYGPISAVIGLLTWLFVFGCVISLSAELCVATDDWLISRQKLADESNLSAVSEVTQPAVVMPPMASTEEESV